MTGRNTSGFGGGEGVESAHQARFLLEQGCRSAQGFYYSKAVPAHAFSDLLRSSSAAQVRGMKVNQ